MRRSAARAAAATRIFAGLILLCASGQPGAEPLAEPLAGPTVDAAINEAADARVGPLSPERQLQSAVLAMHSGHDAEALQQLSSLVQREPNFRLAQLLYGELLGLRSGLPNTSPPADERNPRLRELLDEYRVRIGNAEFAPTAGQLPDAVLKLSGTDRHVLIADLPHSRLYVLGVEGGELHVIENYYSTLARNGYGKQSAGDLRTPVGIYHAIAFKPGGALPAFYGSGAFPLDYPNDWDRAHGRTGRGIWLHGVPASTYARPPRASQGCLVLANEDLLSLKSVIRVGDTPVIFSDGISWRSAEQITERRVELQQRIEDWRTRWSSRDSDAFLSVYADDFHSDEGIDKAAFAASRRDAIAGRQYIEVQVSDLDLFAYPGESGLVLAEFTEDYHSDQGREITRKTQYWRKETEGVWKIVREETHEKAVGIAEPHETLSALAP